MICSRIDGRRLVAGDRRPTISGSMGESKHRDGAPQPSDSADDNGGRKARSEERTRARGAETDELSSRRGFNRGVRRKGSRPLIPLRPAAVPPRRRRSSRAPAETRVRHAAGQSSPFAISTHARPRSEESPDIGARVSRRAASGHGGRERRRVGQHGGPGAGPRSRAGGIEACPGPDYRRSASRDGIRASRLRPFAIASPTAPTNSPFEMSKVPAFGDLGRSAKGAIRRRAT